MTTLFVDAGELMARRSGSVDPSKFPDEEFELHSIPAFDAGKPEVLRGDQIGSTKQLVAPNDVMISKIVPHIRRSTIVPEFTGRRQIASSEWIVFRGSQFFPDYLRHFLTSNGFHARFMSTVSGVGGSLLRARPAEVAKIKIPLPPLFEQRRLAGLLSHAEGIIKLRREAQHKAAELVPALFLDVFGDPASNPKGWPVVPFAEIADTQLGKMLDKKKQTGLHSFPYLGNSNVRWDDFDLDGLLEMDFSDKERVKFQLMPGDLLACEGGEVGRAAIWRGQMEGCFYQKAIHRIRSKPSLAVPEFILHWLWIMSKQGLLVNAGTKATIAHLPAEKLRSLKVALPPIELQRQFAIKADAVRTIAAQQTAALATAQATFDALLHQSFQH